MLVPSSSFSPAATPPPPRPIPGTYGPPVIGPLRDRLDYFWFQTQDEFFRQRAVKHRSTVYRTNIPPSFPFFLGVDPRVVAVLDADAFTALFDPALVDKRDNLIGPYNPGPAFTGGTRVGVFLDTQEPDHRRTKAFAIDLLHRAASSWAAEFRAAAGSMLDAAEDQVLANNASFGFISPLQRCIFRFLCKALVGADPADDWFADRFGPTVINVWLALQVLPTVRIGILQPLEELLLHSFPLPAFPVRPAYDMLYRFIEKHGADAVAVAEKEHGIPKKDAINNVLFVLGFNAYGGFSVFLPSLLGRVGEPGDSQGLRPRLREEVRRVLDARGGGGAEEVGFAAVREMALLRSTVYETLRMTPPVALQFGRARKDFVLRSHGEAFQVTEGELLCGYQPQAMRDPKVFERADEFLPERFLGEEGEALLKYLYWSNGPETEQPAAGNKQCAAKEAVVNTACMLVAELFRRYDDLEVDGVSFTKLVKRQPMSTPAKARVTVGVAVVDE